MRFLAVLCLLALAACGSRSPDYSAMVCLGDPSGIRPLEVTFYEFFEDRGFEIEAPEAGSFVASKTFGPKVWVIWRDMNGREGRTAAWINLSRGNESIERNLRDLIEKELGGFEVSKKGLTGDECGGPQDTVLVP